MKKINTLSIGDKIIISNKKVGNDKKLFNDLYENLADRLSTSKEKEFLWQVLMFVPQAIACEIIASVLCLRVFNVSYVRNADDTIDEIIINKNDYYTYIK